MSPIYLDNNATTALDPRVFAEMEPLFSGFPYNASSTHSFGQRAKGLLIQSTQIVADCMAVSPQEIIFTSGATESLNMVIQGIARARVKGHILTCNLEHVSVLQPLQFLEKQGFEVSYLFPREGEGALSLEDVEKNTQPDTFLIVLMGANNETGILTDIEAIAAFAEERKIGFVVDGVALTGKEECRIPRGVSAFCMSGHKIHGPLGVGCALVRKHVKLQPFILGGPQQLGRRGGTENLPGIVGFAKAIALMQEELTDSVNKMRALRDLFEERLTSLLPDSFIIGQKNRRVCNTSMVVFPHIEGEVLLMRLDLQKVAASHGSACSSGALEPSRVLLGMGFSRQIANSALRFSLSKWTTGQEIDRAVITIQQEVETLASLMS